MLILGNHTMVQSDSSKILDAFIIDDFEMMKALILSKVMDVDAVDPRRKCLTTGLMRATILGRIDIVKWFLDNNARIDKQDSAGFTALHFACLYKHLDIVNALLDAGANVHLGDKYGNTPLFRVFDTQNEKNLRLATILITHGANPNDKNNDGVAVVDNCVAGDMAAILLALYSTFNG